MKSRSSSRRWRARPTGWSASAARRQRERTTAPNMTSSSPRASRSRRGCWRSRCRRRGCAQDHGSAGSCRSTRREAHSKARIQSIDSDRILASMAGGTVAVIPGFQGLTGRGAGHDARPRRIGYLGGRGRGGAWGRALRYLHRRRGRLYHRPEDRAARPQARQGDLRGDARARLGRRQGVADPLGRAGDEGKGSRPCAVVVHRRRGHFGRRRRGNGERSRGKPVDHRRRLQPQRGEDHRYRGARQTGLGRGAVRAAGRLRTSTST